MFDDATRAFNLGEFLTAVNLYRGAYKLKPEPGSSTTSRRRIA